MSKTFKFEVVSPTGIFFEDTVDFVSFHAITGDIGIMANHEPMLIAVKPCTLEIEKDKKKKHAYIGEGFIEVTRSKVSAIVDFAGWPDKLNTELILKEQKRAEEELENGKHDLERKAELTASIERTKAALKTASIRD